MPNATKLSVDPTTGERVKLTYREWKADMTNGGSDRNSTPRGDGETPMFPLSGEEPSTASEYRASKRLPNIPGYEDLKEVGSGGFGVVYRALQTVPVKREVAVKVLKRGLDTQEIVSRFRAEQQALAMMDHPSIATVYDAGETEQGQPYFAMELISGGQALTQYADARRLSLEDRLKLFLHVCHGVHHAHQKGVIHRDLKPSNVLVMEKDGSPLVKIIDFGIAKALDTKLVDMTLQTLPDHNPGTPVYMSPEQATPGTDIDTRSDIYSLGVLFYQLLSGCHPLGREWRSTSDYEGIKRRIREEASQKPSSALRNLDDTGKTNIASRRGISLEKLIGSVKGDLDWITLTALEKDREKRYDSAAAFADDIHRHLKRQPVAAVAPRLSYIVGKLLSRHRVGLAFSLLTLLGLTFGGLALVTSGQAKRDRTASAYSEGLVAQRSLQAGRRSESLAHFARVAKLRPDLPGLRDAVFTSLTLTDLERIPGQALSQSAGPDRWEVIQSGGGTLKVMSPDGEVLHELAAEAPFDKEVAQWQASPDRRHLAVVLEDSTFALVYNLEESHQLEPLFHRGSRVLAVAWSPGGDEIATSTEDSGLYLWDRDQMEGGSNNHVSLRGVNATQLCYLRSDLLAMTVSDGSLRLRQLSQGTDIKDHSLGKIDPQQVRSVGDTLTVTGTREAHWRVFDGSERLTLPLGEISWETAHSLTFLHDGRQLAVGTPRGIRLFETSTGRVLTSAQLAEVTAISESKEGLTIFGSKGALQMSLGPEKPQVYPVLNLSTNLRLGVSSQRAARMIACTQQRLLQITQPGDLRSNELFRYPEPVERLALSPDGEWFAVEGAESLSLRRCESPEQEVIALHPKPEHYQFHPQNSSLLTAAPDGIWSHLLSEPYTQSQVIQVERPGPFALDPTGAWYGIAVDGYRLAIYDRKGQLQLTLEEPPFPHHVDIRISNEGRFLATSTDDGSVHLWNLARMNAQAAFIPTMPLPGLGKEFDDRLLPHSPNALQEVWQADHDRAPIDPYKRAGHLSKLERHEEAATQFELATANPSSNLIEKLHYFGSFYHHHYLHAPDRWVQAAAIYERALRADGDYPFVYLIKSDLALVLANGDADRRDAARAEQLCREVMAEGHDSERVLFSLAFAQLRSEPPNYLDAAETFALAAKKRSNASAVHPFAQALCQAKLGHAKAAAEAWERAEAVDASSMSPFHRELAAQLKQEAAEAMETLRAQE